MVRDDTGRGGGSLPPGQRGGGPYPGCANHPPCISTHAVLFEREGWEIEEEGGELRGRRVEQ